VTENVNKNVIKIDDIKRALQSGDTGKTILLSQQALGQILNNQDNIQEKVEVLYLLAVAQRTKGQISDATDTVNTLIATDPNHARAHQENGYLWLSVGNTLNAATAFARATRLNPALLSSWQKLASLYLELNHTEGQKFALQRAEYLTQ
jgi:predicted Zn-dependent protease